MGQQTIRMKFSMKIPLPICCIIDKKFPAIPSIQPSTSPTTTRRNVAVEKDEDDDDVVYG